MSAQAQGIPDKADYGRIENIPLRKILAYVDQLHKADRAGLHHDIRFGDKELYSWAGKKGLPTPGNKDIVFQQPLHSPEYAGFEGEIASGYGKGVVKTHEKGSAFITEASPEKIKFVLAHKKNPEYYTMIKLKGDRRPWLIINHTPTDPEKTLGSKEAFKKKHLGVVAAENVESVLNGVIEGKIDGASGLFKLKENAVDVMSFRVGKDGRPIMHTERFFGENSNKIQIPKKFINRVARGEIYSVNQSGAPQNAQVTSPLLNMSLENSLKAQKEKGLGLRAALFGFADRPLNYTERESELEELLKYLPEDKFGRPPVARTPESARSLWNEIAGGKHPETDEGIVAYPQEGNPVKVKLRPDYDVKITDVFPGEGKYKGSAGGIVYEGGGRVGTGFDDNYRKWIWDNRESIKGRIAKITSTKKLPSGKYYQPSFVSLHEDYPTKKAGSVPLVVHSIHGDEPAGEAAAKNLDGVNVVDAGNHTGKRKLEGKDLNRHFGKKDASKENKAILNKVINSNPSLLVDLHEDNSKDEAYAYSSKDMAEKVKNILRKSGLPLADSAEGDKASDGVIVDGKYPGRGSLVMEANKKGIPYVLLEAPGKESMSTRVNFLKKVVKRLVNEKRGAEDKEKHKNLPLDVLKGVGIHRAVDSGLTYGVRRGGLFKNYYANVAREGMQAAMTGKNVMPRWRRALGILSPNLSGLTDYEVFRGLTYMIKAKLQKQGIPAEALPKNLNDLLQHPVVRAYHKQLSGKKGLSPLARNFLNASKTNLPKNKLVELFKRWGGVGVDRQVNPGLAGGVLAAATGAPHGIAGAASAVLSSSPDLVMAGMAQNPTTLHGLEDLKLGLIGLGNKHGLAAPGKAKALSAGFNIFSPSSAEVYDLGRDLGTLTGMDTASKGTRRKYLQNVDKHIINPAKQVPKNLVNAAEKGIVRLFKRGADFAPDYTPEQLKEMGVFDEVYARTKPRLASLNTWPAHWFHPEDKMGWLEWYEKYNAGRRMEDDARQIKRWNAFRSRHGGQMFQNNPTPRRAYALRNWGIDPVKLLNNEEKKVKLIEAMQAYKSKKYDKIEKNV